MADELQEYRQEFSDDTAEWHDIRQEGAKDMRYVGGDPWDPKDRALREAAGRPCLSLDELGQYVNQGINKLRANKRAVQFTAVGDGADDKTAEFYADKMREIEYRSQAQIAYITAAENAFQRSYGFCRVDARYEGPTSVSQDLWIDPMHNPDLVTPDPYALMPNMSDMKHCWIRTPMLRTDFNRKWPKAKLDGPGLQWAIKEASNWVTDRLVWVAERWEIKTTKKTLLIVQPNQPQQPGSMLGLREMPTQEPIGIFKDDYKRGMGAVKRERQVEDQSIYHCLTNGIDILEERAWPGKYIPVAACLGKVLYIDGQRVMLSLVRLARDPYMAYCFYRSSEIENVGMTTKNPYWAYEGQLSLGQKEEVKKSMHEPVAVLEAKAKIDGVNEILPLPQRNVNAPLIEGLSMGAEEMRRAIQAAMSQSPLPTAAQRRNEKSGVALKHIEESIEIGSYHFSDHYQDMIRHVGVIVEDLMDKIYDTARQVGVRHANDDAEVIWINNGQQRGSVSTKGRHNVTVSTGPGFDSEREAASDFADTLATQGPELFQILGPLIVKLKNLGPIGDEMAELLEAVQPPPIQQMRAQKRQGQGQADPAAMMQENAALKNQLQQVMQMADEMKKLIDSEKIKQMGTLEKAKIDGQIAIHRQQMQDATSIAVAKINALTKGITSDNEAQVEAIALAHEADQADMDRAHELAMATAAHQQALQLGEQAAQHSMMAGDQAHQQALEQGDQGIAGTLATQQQAADLAPEPTNGAGA